MGVSTQRLLMIIIGINLILSLAFSISGDPRNLDYGVFGENIDLGDNLANNLDNERASVNPQNLQEEGSFGGVLSMGWAVMKIFARGLVPLPLFTDAFSGTPLMRLVSIILLLLWALMYMLLVIEAYKFFKNRKTT